MTLKMLLELLVAISFNIAVFCPLLKFSKLGQIILVFSWMFSHTMKLVWWAIALILLTLYCTQAFLLNELGVHVLYQIMLLLTYILFVMYMIAWRRFLNMCRKGFL